MPITRRAAIQTLAAAGATAALPTRAWARPPKKPTDEAVAFLYDPTLCIGCRDCIRGCAEYNNGDVDVATLDDARVSPLSLTVLRRIETEDRESFFKIQCMHCVDPACVSACMLGAMYKQEDGAVRWNGDLCVGCRYCQIGCPFTLPRFEWDTPLPELAKCQMCPERREQGLEPACVEKCRMKALVFGSRKELLAEAHRRIEVEPARYEPKVYGEHDGGGTSALYLSKAGVSFAQMGLPELGEKSVPSLPETMQHTIYKGMIAPLALLGVLGATVHRNFHKLHAEAAAGEATHEHEHSEPVGGSLLTWPVMLLLTLSLIGVAAVAWRFFVGLGPTTNLSDGYPMGLWIAFDVVTGTALACGGYAVALLVYLLNRGKYHPLVRAALVTSALGYTLGGMSVLIDLGRWWNFWKIPLSPGAWNFNSILLEVALCIMLYTTVLWIEVSPAIFEGWQRSHMPRLRRLAVWISPKLERAMPYAIALGLLLPTMHQSSLGSLMLLGGAKVHALWSTPLLPLLFLVSCVAMGYAAVTLEACISSRVFRRPSEVTMLRALGGPVSLVLLAYVILRTIDVVVRGQAGAALALDGFSILFLTEMALFAVPAVGLLVWRRDAEAGFLMTMGVAVILAGGLYRFSTFLIAFNPGAEWAYFPSLAEFAVTIGLVAAEILGYVILVKWFPILRGAPSAPQVSEVPVAAPRPAIEPARALAA
jgi:Ni/Fe-hydrogenase subunit HybB-like protein/Fe-S-cluster-containing dehydrogenase component